MSKNSSEPSSCQRRTEVLPANDTSIARAIEVLRAGGLVAFPTDTVYGLATLPWNADAVEGLYEAKRRPSDKPIPLLLSDVGLLDHVAVPSPRFKHKFKRLASHFWPGGLTLVLRKKKIVLDLVSAGPNVAVRVPDLSLTRDLIRSAGGVLAVTSANLSGQLNPLTAQEVEQQLGGRIDLILDGGTSRGGIPSTILDCTVFPPLLLRHGAIHKEDLGAVIGPIKTPS